MYMPFEKHSSMRWGNIYTSLHPEDGGSTNVWNAGILPQ